MSFTSYKPFKKRNLFPKYMIVFLLGIFSVVLFTRAINIVTDINNATQYIKQIIVTSDGTSAGSQAVVIDAAATNNLVINGKSRFNSGVNIIGDLDGSKATFNTGEFTNVLSQNYCNKDGTTCKTIADIGGSYWKEGVFQGMIYYNSGNVGIGTNNPSQILGVSGNVAVSGNIAVSGTGTFKLLGAGTLGIGGKDSVSGIFGGKVGMGTADPQSTLDILGDLIVSGTGDIEMLDANHGKFGSSIAIPSVSSTTGASNTCTNLGGLKFEYFFEELCVCNGASWIRASDPSLLCVPSAGGPDPK